MLLTVLGAGLAGLAALPHGAQAQTVIEDDTHFYGQSPPVYPSPNMTGTGSWASAFAKANALVANMTLEEKVNLTAGIAISNSCGGNIPAVPRLGFPGMCLSDAGNGLRETEYVSGWPAGVAVAASWNKGLARKRAAGMGAEFKKKGVNVLLGPVVGPMGRIPLGGRNWEGLSADPHLAGALVYETVQGAQGAGVMTSVKHFISYEQETLRQPSTTNATDSVSSNIDDKTMHEMYLWPFQDAVHAGTTNIMCSYNRINNSHASANSKTLNGLLKTELSFQGFVVSDWGAQHAGVASALAGLDMAMPDSEGFWGANLSAAATNGSVPVSRLDDMVTRILAAWYQVGQDADFPLPGSGMPADTQAPHEVVDARDPANKAVLLDGAIEGHVLLKNTGGALPLGKPGTLSVFGYSARSPDQNSGMVGGDSLAWMLGAEAYNVTEFVLGFDGLAARSDPVAINGTLYSGGGSGAVTPNFAISPFDALVNQAYDDDTNLYWDFAKQDPWVPYASDACLVFINAYATEGQDRGALYDDYSDGLVLNVAAKCNNTMVIIHNAGPRLVDRWVDHKNVTALIYAHYPGQSSGKAIVSVLYGDTSPSGRLPYTVARNESEYAPLDPDLAVGEWAVFPQSDFSEGVLIDYRYFDAKNITPRYAFGFGLSYTTFAYSGLAINKTAATTTVAATAEYPTGAVEPGGQADLWDELVTVTAEVANTGSVGAYEVAQLYVGIPSEGAPLRQLRAFEKPYVSAGASAEVTFSLTRKDLSVWDVAAQKWYLPRGDLTIEVGPNSRDLPLAGSVAF